MMNGRCDRPIERPAMVICSLIGNSSFLLDADKISMSAEVEKRRKPDGVSNPQQIEFYGEKLAVDFVDQFMAFQHQMPLRPDCTGINLILRLNQRHDNVVSAFEDLPDVRRPSTPLGEIAGVNDKACCIFLAILSGDNLMTRNQKENVASGQFDLALDEFDIVM